MEYGKRVFESAETLGIDKKEAKRIAKLSDALSVPVTFFDDKNKMLGGYYKNGEIFINKNSDNPFFDTFKHELVHFIESDTKEYNDYANYVFEVIK